MKKYFAFAIFISVLIFSCSPQKNSTNNSGGTISEKDKEKPVSADQKIKLLQNRIDSLIEAMQNTTAESGTLSESAVRNGALGDVKYSVLPEWAFQQENGNCWVLLDSTKKDFFSSELYNKYSKYGLLKLPDGRGVFIRGMMTDSSKLAKEKGDPDGIRSIGKLQKDTFKLHFHNLSAQVWTIEYPQGSNPSPTGTPANASITKTEEEGGDETRPKNIALYIYIKICND